MQGGHDPEFREARVRELAVHQALWDHPDHLAIGRQRSVGDRAHQSDLPAAVDDADAAGRKTGAQRRGERAVRRIVPGAGAAEHTDATDRRHGRLRTPGP